MLHLVTVSPQSPWSVTHSPTCLVPNDLDSFEKYGEGFYRTSPICLDLFRYFSYDETGFTGYRSHYT